MKKLAIALTLVLSVGYVANNVYAATTSAAKMELKKDGDKDKKKKKGSSEADSKGKSCSSSSSTGTQKSCCSKK